MDKTILIHTKLMPPRVNNTLIDRPRLWEKLDLGLQRKLSLVSAPAGYGKTMLVSAWLPDVSRPAAWISLDENDNDLMLFLRYVVSAIRSLFPAACADTLQLIQAGQSLPPGYLAAHLINDIAGIPDNFILVFDDYHLILDDAVNNLIAELIEKQPPNLLLVITTRKDPRLPLARLRAANEMTEIRQRDLRFQTEETETFLQQTFDLSIEPELAVILNKHTEGWAVGLNLVALSLQDSKDLDTLLHQYQGDTNHFVSDYLISEVLTQQPAQIRTFLLESSILDRMCQPLCQVIMQLAPDDQTSLEMVKEANLFLIALDNRGEWYRYHHLIRTFLQRKLYEEYKESEISALRDRASHWFADQGFIDEAIHHALKANDEEAAVNILEINSQNLLNSLDRHTLDRWLSRLPEETIWRRPRLILAKAWLLFREYRMTALDATLDIADTALETEKTDKDRQSLQGQVATLRAFTATFQHHDYLRAYDLAEKALQWLPDFERGARGAAMMSWAHAQLALGNGSKVVRRLQAIIQHPTQTGPSKLQTFIALTFLRNKTGDLQQMSKVLAQFQVLATQTKNPNAIVALNMQAGRLHYEWNNLEQATNHFLVTHDYRYRANFIAAFDGALGLARIYVAQKAWDKAQTVIDDLRADTLRLENSDLLGPLEAFQARLWLAKNQPSLALGWARSVDLDHVVDSAFISEVASLTYGRILISAGTMAEKLNLCDFLQAKLAQAENEHFTLRVIQTHIHLALVQQKLAEPEEALASLKRAISLAEPGGFIRTFIDVGNDLRPLLEILHAQDIAPHYLPHILAAFPEIEPSSMRPSLATATLLTRRETEILQLMQNGRSNQEIADALVISIHTVKRHATNIYNKLEVNGRQTAIFRAIELNIFS